jgi:5'-3' exonuclease
MKCKHLLIDAKNMLYRAVFTARSDKKFTQRGHHPINIVLHFLTFYLEKFNPDEIHIFWDSRRDLTWRRAISPQYKGTRGSDPEIHEILVNLTEVCTTVFSNIGMKQYYKDGQEADDLIYSFCKLHRRTSHNPESEIIIVSSDGDLKQISFNFRNVRIHHPLAKDRMFEPTPLFDPVTYKCLVGDKSDNIDGYFGVGDVKAKLLIEDQQKRHEFFESAKAVTKKDGKKFFVGAKKFIENNRLIDLSLCPYVLENMEYVLSKQTKQVKFDLEKVRELISKYKLRGVTADISRYVTPFKKLAEDPDG